MGSPNCLPSSPTLSLSGHRPVSLTAVSVSLSEGEWDGKWQAVKSREGTVKVSKFLFLLGCKFPLCGEQLSNLACAHLWDNWNVKNQSKELINFSLPVFKRKSAVRLNSTLALSGCFARGILNLLLSFPALLQNNKTKQNKLWTVLSFALQTKGPCSELPLRPIWRILSLLLWLLDVESLTLLAAFLQSPFRPLAANATVCGSVFSAASLLSAWAPPALSTWRVSSILIFICAKQRKEHFPFLWQSVDFVLFPNATDKHSLWLCEFWSLPIHISLSTHFCLPPVSLCLRFTGLFLVLGSILFPPISEQFYMLFLLLEKISAMIKLFFWWGRG